MTPPGRKKQKNLSILITAGPTRERIDPVRFISNFSTGVFGYEIAKQALRRGHKVTLISGPVSLKPPRGAKMVNIETAVQMSRAVMENRGAADCIIMTAAVCDWRVRRPSREKMKKDASGVVLELVENPDILRELGAEKKGKILVGFAVETENIFKNALQKARKKNLDFIVANRLRRNGNIFGQNPAEAFIIDRSGNITALGRRSKKELAKIILDKISNIRI